MFTLPLALLLACPVDDGTEPPDETDADTDTDADSDADADADSDTDTDCDTGIGIAYWIGAFEADGAAYVSAEMGTGVYGTGLGDWACRVTGPMDYEGPGPEGCPDCTWSWDLSAVHDSVAVGDYCGSGDLSWSDGEVDGDFAYSWGFSERYAYSYDDTMLYFEDNLMLYGTSGWFVFAFTLPDYGIYETYVEGGTVSFYRMLTSSSGAPYYYYYGEGC